MHSRSLSLLCWAAMAAQLPLALTQPFGAPPLELNKNERIAFVGNSLAERMNLYGHFEALLHARFPLHALAVRNFAWPCDEVGNQQRPNDYFKLDDPLQVFAPDVFLCFFGFNESFAGREGLNAFREELDKYLAATGQKYSKNGSTPRFVLISPIAYESAGDPLLPSGQAINENLKLYTAAMRDAAGRLKLPFADLFTPTAELFQEKPGAQFTINGAHINEAGDRAVAELLDRALFGSAQPAKAGSPAFERLRSVVTDKSWVHMQDYRMLNGWYVYGSRRAPYDTETFPEEYKKIRAMAAVRDRYIWDLVAGKPVSTGIDDSSTGVLTVPKTAFGTKTYSEPKELRYLNGVESLSAMTVPAGFEVSLFASEERFPELAKPVQLAFDNKGRLWAACMPTYPQWKPGDPKPSDRLLLFEDADLDGRADRVKVFYNELHCPTGFEFWNGGVLVVSQPRILFLKDTDGDDKADHVVHLTDGWASDDTHHTVGAWEWSHGGRLHMLEGVAMSTTVETPWGPFRNKNTPGSYVFDPRSLKVRHFITPGYGNPWCYVFNWWGQGIVGDGTTAQQHWDTPLSGAQFQGRKGLNPIFNNEGMRPAIGSEFIYSRHFPDELQGQFLYACVINMNGIPRFEIRDDGAGYSGKRIPDLLTSTDRNFRPADPQIGPDGALWFADWHNPLIGHMQYSQRDPNRDHTRGRIYRLTAQGRPLLRPVTQHGKSVAALLDQLKEYEPRTRYRVRRELRDRPTKEILAAIKSWVAKLDPKEPNHDLLITEVLWIQQGHHAVDLSLLQRGLRAATPEARAAATHILADEWDRLPNPVQLLRPQVTDDHPRVRLEAVRALSSVPSSEAVELTLEAARLPSDYHLDYTLQHTLGALEPVWKAPFQNGDVAKNNPEGREYLAALIAGRPQLGGVQKHLRTLMSSELDQPEARQRALAAVTAARGRPDAGKQVFDRICVACHKVGTTGLDFGPDLTNVGARMKREDLIESILYPNEKVDPKYLMVNVTTADGKELSGFIDAEDEHSLTLRLGAAVTETVAKRGLLKRDTLKVSNMPEGLAETVSTAEFVDLIEYLAAQK